MGPSVSGRRTLLPFIIQKGIASRVDPDASHLSGAIVNGLLDLTFDFGLYLLFGHLDNGLYLFSSATMAFSHFLNNRGVSEIGLRTKTEST